MKVRKAKKSANSKRPARQVARQDAEVADLKAQLDEARALVNSPAEQIKTLTKRITQFASKSIAAGLIGAQVARSSIMPRCRRKSSKASFSAPG